MDDNSEQPERLILFTKAALTDLAGIDNRYRRNVGVPVEEVRFLIRERYQAWLRITQDLRK
jgi:hypothetical protein